MDELTGTSGAGTEGEVRLARAIAHFVQRMEAGEEIHPDEVYREYPDLARELLKHLELARSLMGKKADSSSRQRVFGDYILIREIGRGGMGAIVYEALQISVNRKVALKVLSPFWAADRKVVDQFVLEAQIAARLNHPHVVPVFGAGTEDGIPYYAMELVLGETLASRIRRARGSDRPDAGAFQDSLLPETLVAAQGALPKADRSPEEGSTQDRPVRPSDHGGGQIGYRESLEVALAFAGAADGLEQAHEKKIIHRDIKPSNLIFDPDGRLRILDFGLARLAGQESLQASGRIAGTLPYMSPEQARPRKASIDRRSDIYSMGATLYEVLTLEPPFTGESHEVLEAIATRDPVRPRRKNPRVHKHLEAIVLKCLRKSPRDRYTTAAELARDLRLFASGEAPLADPPSTIESVVKFARRNKLLIVLVASVVSLVVAAGAYFHQKAKEDLRKENTEYTERVSSVLFKLQGEFHREALTAGDIGSIFQDEFFSLLGPALEGSGVGFGDLEESVEEIQAITRDFPRRPDASYHLARLYEHMDKTPEAIEALKEALRRDRNFLPALLLHASLASGESSGTVQAVLAKHGGNAWAGAWLDARAASEARRWEDAATHLEEAMVETAKSGEPYVGALLEMRLERAMVHLRSPARPILAHGDLAVVESEWPNVLELELLNAVVFFMNGDRELADDAFQRVYDRDPSDAAALWIAGTYFTLAPSAPSIPSWLDRVKDERLRDMGYFVLHCWTEPYEKAIELGEKILGENPGAAAPRIHSSLGWPLNLLGRYREAREHAELALGADPNLRWARLHLGKALFFMGEPARGLEMFEEEKRRQSDNPWVPAFAGGHLIEAGFIEEGLALAKEAVGIDGNLVRAWRYVGDAHYYAERFLDAKDAFERVVNHDGKESPVVLLSEACALSKLGMPYQAQLGRALRLPLPKPLAELRLGWIRGDEGDEDQALAHFEAAAGGGDAFWRANFAMARILEEREPLEALRRYGRVMKGNPNHRETHARAVTLVRSRLSPEDDPKVRKALREITLALEEARAQGVSAPHVEHTLAFALLHGNDPQLPRAMELAQSAAEKMGGDAEVLATLSEAQCATKDNGSAVTTLERALDLPGAGEHLERLAPVLRRAALPDLPTYGSIDAALEGTAPGSEDRLREGLLAFVADPGPRLHYLDARIHQRAGRLAEAIEGFQAVLAADGSRPEPVERLAEAHLANGEAARAEEILGAALMTELRSRRDLWKLWARVSFQARDLTASSALALLPASSAEPQGAADPGADVRWVLEGLTGGTGTIRIDCGAKEPEEGSPWGRDRFFVGGAPAEVQVGIPDEEESVYRTQRWFAAKGDAVEYQIPVPSATYRVTLHFAEVRLPLGRRFDALVEGAAANGNSPLGESGFAQPVSSAATVHVTDGLLEIDLVPGKGEPSIAAIEISRIDG